MAESIREALIRRVANALKDAHFKQLHERLSEHDLKAKDFENFFIGLMNEGDRALAIVAYAYIDERLKELFVTALNPNISGGLESLLGGMGPLSSSSARIQLAASLYWLRRETYQNLNLLRKIRNDFAHDPLANDFSSRRISGLVSSMTPIEMPILKVVEESTGEAPQLTLRETFFIRAVITCQSMIAEVAALPVALRMGLPGEAALGRGYDSMPQKYRDLANSAATVALTSLGQLR